MIGKNNLRKDYPNGTKIMLKHANSKLAFRNDVLPLENVGTIISFISWDMEDEEYDEIEILWDNGQTTSLLLMSVIRAEDAEDYVREQTELRTLKFTITDSFTYLDGSKTKALSSVEEWFELDMDFERKIALISARVPLANIHLYDELTNEEIKSLKHHLRAMEGIK